MDDSAKHVGVPPPRCCGRGGSPSVLNRGSRESTPQETVQALEGPRSRKHPKFNASISTDRLRFGAGHPASDRQCSVRWTGAKERQLRQKTWHVVVGRSDGSHPRSRRAGSVRRYCDASATTPIAEDEIARGCNWFRPTTGTKCPARSRKTCDSGHAVKPTSVARSCHWWGSSRRQ